MMVANDWVTTDKQWYTLVSDDDGHDYVVSADKAANFYWDLEDRPDEVPDYAVRVEHIKFTEWREI